MKTFARYAWTMPVLAVGLFMSGCATPRTARYYRTVPLSDFTVISSSSDRKLSTAEMDQLQAGVEKFLAGQGLVHSGDYLVRIDFAPAAPGLPAEWVLVKLTSLPVPNLPLVEIYPAVASVDYAYPYTDGYGYAPYGYDDAFGFYYPWDFHRTSPVRHYDGYGDHRPGGYRPGDRNDPPGKYAGGGQDRHPGGPPRRDGGQPGHDHPTRTAGYEPHSPEAGGRPGGYPHSPPPPRPDRAPPAPAVKQDKVNDATVRDKSR
jgi:hypothetical protein